MERDDAKTRFLTAIGHDLRQPLHALLLYLNALDRRVHDEEARAILGKADLAAQSLANSFESLVQLARIEAGKIEPEIERVSLQSLFEDVVANAPHASADATSLFVRSDPALLEAILRTLTANAVKHGGGDAWLSARESNGAVEISVRDRGPGIAAGDQQRIFGEFVRLEGAPADGLGVGLTIARNLATLLKHEIEVRSALGEGATFTVRAPSA